MKRAKQRRRRAFTLIELLVVIGIIAVLAALVFPVFQTARNHSKSSVCLSNLSQVGKAIALYAADYDDRLPRAPDPLTKKLVLDGKDQFGRPLDDEIRLLPDVRAVLKPYGVSQPLFVCPMDRIDEALANEGGHAPTWHQECGSSYDYDDDWVFLGNGTLSGYPKPSQGILSSDRSFFHARLKENDGMTNALFADLHVKTISWQERVRLRRPDDATR